MRQAAIVPSAMPQWKRKNGGTTNPGSTWISHRPRYPHAPLHFRRGMRMRNLLCLVVLVCGLRTFAAPATAPTTAPAKAPQRIVYILDKGGSMLADNEKENDYVLQQIGALTEKQRFNLIILAEYDNQPVPVMRRQMVFAN